MAIRNKPRERFTQIRNEALLDKSLSLKAKGLLAIMLSRPDDWDYFMSWLEQQSRDGREATQNAMRELIRAGYVSRRKINGKGGRLEHLYLVSDVPETTPATDGKAVNGLAVNGLTVNGEPATTNTEVSTKTDLSNTDQPTLTLEVQSSKTKSIASEQQFYNACLHTYGELKNPAWTCHGGLTDTCKRNLRKAAKYFGGYDAGLAAFADALLQLRDADWAQTKLTLNNLTSNDKIISEAEKYRSSNGHTGADAKAYNRFSRIMNMGASHDN